MNKADMVDDEELLSWLKWKFVNFLTSTSFRVTTRRLLIGSATKALEGDTSDIGVPAILKLVETLDIYIPEPSERLTSHS